MKIVLLPGLDGTGGLFKPFVEQLPKEFDAVVIAYPPNLKLSYGELIDLVIRQLPDEKFILVAESFSGYIAYRVALGKPKNLKSVVFVATFLENPRPFLLGLSNWLPRSLLLSFPIPNYIVKTLLLGKAANTKLIDLFTQSIKMVSPDVLSFRLHEITKLGNNHPFCDIKATYIQATDDKLVPERCLGTFKKVFSTINTFQIEGSHFILQAKPAACVEVIVNENTL